MAEIRHNWSRKEITEIYETPFLELMYRAATVHREHHDPQEVQMCTLLSIKTGGCPEDCAYCPQAARYHTNVKSESLLDIDTVCTYAKEAKEAGSSRFCMGAAWRNIRNNQDFDHVLEMVKKVNAMGLEVCCTLGMLTEKQAQKLAEAGLYAYNHNLDTSPEYYSEIISTRKYTDRLETIEHVQNAGVSVCSGGIIGMGETTEDRIGMLHTLATINPHPESVPINTLVAIPGTPLEDQDPVPIWDVVRMVATARIIIPQAIVRLSAGRTKMSWTDQALCFMAGANSIFTGEKLLTTSNPEFQTDQNMFDLLGLLPRASFKKAKPIGATG